MEDGAPLDLAADPESRYRALLDAERTMRERLWSGEEWRRVAVENGEIHEQERRSYGAGARL